MSDVTQFSTKSRVMQRSERCEACGEIIDENNWYFLIHYFLDDGHYNIPIHDNDICIHTIKVRLGLERSNFWSSISYRSAY